MNSLAIPRILFLAGVVCASAYASEAFAGNDINKCITPTGYVTLTDEVCPSDTETVKVINGAPDNDTAIPTRNGIEHYTVARIPARYARLMRKTQPAGGLALDVATLKAARANLQILAPRAQRIAGL